MGASGWEVGHISAYAAVQPHEDWAETFAHYLHVRDTLQTANALGLRVTNHTSREARGEWPRGGPPPQPSPFTVLLDEWRPIISAVNAVARSLGAGDVYPFALTSTVVDKLSFVHERVAAR